MVKRHLGFTLIELMVSLVLLSMVILIGSSAFSMFSSRWDGRLGKFSQSVSQARNMILVEEALSSIIPYVTFDEKNNPQLYFEGNRNGFVAVTLRPVFSPDQAAVIRIQAIQQADLSFKLSYQEWPMEEGLLVNSQQEIPFNAPLVLFSDLKQVDFSYFGWRSLKDRDWTPDSLAPSREPKDWLNNYNSLTIGLQPEKVAIEFQGDKAKHSIFAELIAQQNNLLSLYNNDNQ